MDASELEQACRKVVATASRLDQRDAGSDTHWAPSRVLAHLIAANRNMTELVARVMAGAQAAPFTNRGALQWPHLNTSAALGDDAGQAVIATAFWEAEGIIFEGPMPLSQLFTVIHGHLEGHVQQLSGLTREG